MCGVTSAIAADPPTPVTIDTFIRAETDHYFRGKVERSGVGVWWHDREPMPLDEQIVIKPSWNCVLRLYRPRKEILDDTWKAPELGRR